MRKSLSPGSAADRIHAVELMLIRIAGERPHDFERTVALALRALGWNGEYDRWRSPGVGLSAVSIGDAVEEAICVERAKRDG